MSCRRSHTRKQLYSHSGLTIIAVLMMFLIATVLPYHHHDGDKVCFLWSAEHTEHRCCTAHNEASGEHPIDHETDECGLHSTQILAESLDDNNCVQSSDNGIDLPGFIYGFLSANLGINFGSEKEIQRFEIFDDVSLKRYLECNNNVRRGPPCFV